MNSDHIDVLMKDYQVHCSMIEKLTSPLYNLAPVAIVACGALLLNGNAGYAAIGIAACVALLIMLVWVCYVQSAVCSEALRLVEIELKVGELLGAEQNGFDWWTRYTGEGTSRWKGWARLHIITLAMGILVLTASLGFSCRDLLQLGVPLWGCLLGIVVILTLVGALCCNAYRIEMDTRRAKADLIRCHKSTHG